MSDDQTQSTSFQPPSLEELDSLLAGYHFESFIAQGGMGAVYLARQTSLDRPVAVKFLPREFGQDEEFRKLFQTEAKLMAKLNHPNLIGIYDFGDIDGMLYIIMEYVKGQSLFHSAHGKAIEQKTAAKIISGVCSGLDHAHEAGILHRDIKPANILLTGQAVPKVGDFGLARPNGMTETGDIYGTPGYSAPEVLSAPEKVDNRTDVFAVGVMFYELLTGKMPSDDYESVTEFTQSDGRFDEIIQRAINPNIELRHHSAGQFMAEINAVLQSPANTGKLKLSTTTAKVATVAGNRTGKLKSSAAAPAALTTARTTVSSPPASHARAVNTVPANTKLLRNIVIIFILIGAIYAVLEMKKVKEKEVAEKQKVIDAEVEAKQSAKQAKIDAIAAERRKEAEARAASRRPRNQNTTNNSSSDQTNQEDPSTPPPVEVKLQPLEQLEKIKELLSNGERPMTMMPDTIFMRDQDSRIIMYIDKKMTWDEADEWTREHGGYLAVCRTKSDLTILMKQIPADAGDVWLGAGTSGDKGWCWVDDTPWTDTIPVKPTYNRAFAKVSKYGTVGKKHPSSELNFFIEWRADGTNPAELEYRLLRTSDTLTDINPVYPPGTISSGARNYCIVKSPKSLTDATELAIASGGHLIAISNDEEKYQVEGIIAEYCKPGEVLWTAGEKQQDIWGWQTGEKWLKLSWSPEYPKSDKYVVIAASEKLTLRDQASHKKADGFIIEWSKDKSKVKVANINDADGDSSGGLSALNSKAKLLVHKQISSTEKKLASNVKKLWSDLETYLRGLPKNQKLAESIPIGDIVKKVKDQTRIPKTIAGMGTSDRSRDYTNYAVEKQARIEQDHDIQMELLRTGYLNQLQKLKLEMEKKGQTSAVKAIMEEARKVGDTPVKFENYFKP